MIPISKDEAMYLRSLGYHCPMTNKRKHSKQKNYYAIEENNVLKAIQAYQNNLITNNSMKGMTN